MRSNRTLLIVEGNSSAETLALKGLLECGQIKEVEVIRHKGQSITDLLAPKGVSPSLIVLEISSPETDAVALLRELRSHEQTRYVPIVMLSPEQPEATLLEYLKEGADQVLETHSEPAAYVKHVCIMAEAWLAVDERPPQNLPTHVPDQREE
jgi:CheY-like chemotaxis protein